MIFQDNNLFDKEDSYSLKGVCMIFIIMHHIYQYTSAKFGVSYPLPLAIILQDLGHIMTGVFFMLSGYGIFQSLNKNKAITLNYAITHLWKLIKPFLFIFVVDVIIYSVINAFDISLFVRNLLTLSLSNSTIWFMKVIFCLYLVVFLLHFAIKSPPKRASIIFIVCCLYVFWAVNSKFGAQWWNSVLCFPIGYSLAAFNISNIYQLWKADNSKIAFYVWGGVICLFTISYVGSLWLNSTAKTFSVISTIFFSFSSILFASKINLVNRFSSFVGKYSLCFYLFHFYCLRFTCVGNITLYIVSILGGCVLLTVLYIKIEKLADLLYVGKFK